MKIHTDMVPEFVSDRRGSVCLAGTTIQKRVLSREQGQVVVRRRCSVARRHGAHVWIEPKWERSQANHYWHRGVSSENSTKKTNNPTSFKPYFQPLSVDIKQLAITPLTIGNNRRKDSVYMQLFWPITNGPCWSTIV